MSLPVKCATSFEPLPAARPARPARARPRTAAPARTVTAPPAVRPRRRRAPQRPGHTSARRRCPRPPPRGAPAAPGPAPGRRGSQRQERSPVQRRPPTGQERLFHHQARVMPERHPAVASHDPRPGTHQAAAAGTIFSSSHRSARPGITEAASSSSPAVPASGAPAPRPAPCPGSAPSRSRVPQSQRTSCRRSGRIAPGHPNPAGGPAWPPPTTGRAAATRVTWPPPARSPSHRNGCDRSSSSSR